MSSTYSVTTHQTGYEGSDYHSSIGPRDTFARTAMNRASARSPVAGSGSRVLKIVTEMGSSAVTGISAALGADAATSIMESREREKRDMQDLNDRLASYIERVRFLEAQNRKLVDDLEAMRGRWGKDTGSIKELYDGELTEARRLMDDGAKTKAALDVQVARLQDNINEIRMKLEEGVRFRNGDKESIEQYTIQLADSTTEIDMLRRRLQGLIDEQARYLKDNERASAELNKAQGLADSTTEIDMLRRRLQGLINEQARYLKDNEQASAELTKAQGDLDAETVARIDYQNQVQTLLEEIEFLRRVYDQEVKELQALVSNAHPDNKDYFKNELALAIRDIRGEYDVIAGQTKTDMESWYKLKVQEVQASTGNASVETTFQKEEVRRVRAQLNDTRTKLSDLENRNALLEKQAQELRYQLDDDSRQYESAINDRDTQIRKMREECQALMVELQMLMDTKQTMDAEIAIYRKMLEGEESRAGLRSLVEQVVKTHSIQSSENTDSNRGVRGESSTRTSFQRSAKGNVTIADIEVEGKYIALENTHRTKEEDLSDWKVRRKIDGVKEMVYTIPHGFVLAPGATLKIWANTQGAVHSPPDALVFEGESSWGIGNAIQTILYNTEGEERATHTQRVQ